MSHPLTQEQQVAVEHSQTGKSLKIEAFAGAGKTSTLVPISHAKGPEQGVYLSFNNDIVKEAKEKFPKASVKCKTGHGLAYPFAIRHYGGIDALNERLKGRLTPKAIMQDLGIKGMDTIPAFGVAILALQTVKNFCQSGDASISIQHLPPHLADKNQIASEIIGTSYRLWEGLIDRKSHLPITHDVYLKLWSLGNPQIWAKYILYDESQDANGVMLSIVQRQFAQKIYVGDTFQQIYSWRGAVNAMQLIQTDYTCALTQSFRFGQPVADVANCVLNNFLGAGVNIRGFEKINSVVGETRNPDAILCRTNGILISKVLGIIEANPGANIAVAGGVNDLIILLTAANHLKSGQRTFVPELAAFESWRELVEFSESEAGSDLAPLVKLIESRDVHHLISILERVAKIKEGDARLILSTAHKSKGREWDSVQLANDFRYPKKGEENLFDPEEANLLYVAATRAKKMLDISGCDAALKAVGGYQFQPVSSSAISK